MFSRYILHDAVVFFSFVRLSYSSSLVHMYACFHEFIYVCACVRFRTGAGIRFPFFISFLFLVVRVYPSLLLLYSLIILLSRLIFRCAPCVCIYMVSSELCLLLYHHRYYYLFILLLCAHTINCHILLVEKHKTLSKHIHARIFALAFV